MTKQIRTLICIGVAGAVCAPVTAGAAQEGGVTMSAARAGAIHECATAAAKYLDYVWGNTEMFVYRACMRRHVQSE
jgi:hypothetical protein